MFLKQQWILASNLLHVYFWSAYFSSTFREKCILPIITYNLLSLLTLLFFQVVFILLLFSLPSWEYFHIFIAACIRCSYMLDFFFNMLDLPIDYDIFKVVNGEITPSRTSENQVLLMFVCMSVLHKCTNPQDNSRLFCFGATPTPDFGLKDQFWWSSRNHMGCWGTNPCCLCV